MNNTGPDGRLLSLLSLCRRAAKLAMGFDQVMDTVANQTAGGVFLARDLSAKTAKEAGFLCEKHHVPVYWLPVTMDEVQTVAGKRSGVIAITDQGLAKKLSSLLGPECRPQ